MDNLNTAAAIADMIHVNCDALDKGVVTRSEWDAQQTRLWKLAADAHLATSVMRIVCPSLSAVKS